MDRKEEAYRESLDEMDAGELFSNYSNARILEAVDPVAYRCGLADFEDSMPCVECGEDDGDPHPGTGERLNDDGLCMTCAGEDEDEDEEESVPCPKCDAGTWPSDGYRCEVCDGEEV